MLNKLIIKIENILNKGNSRICARLFCSLAGGSSTRTRTPEGSQNSSSLKERMVTAGGEVRGDQRKHTSRSKETGKRSASYSRNPPTATWRVCSGPGPPRKSSGVWMKRTGGHGGLGEGSKKLSPFPVGVGINTQTRHTPITQFRSQIPIIHL